MGKILFILLISFVAGITETGQFNSSALPVWKENETENISQDWLVKPVAVKAQVYKSADNKNIILYNGLLKRVFLLQQNVACTDYTNLKK